MENKKYSLCDVYDLCSWKKQSYENPFFISDLDLYICSFLTNFEKCLSFDNCEHDDIWSKAADDFRNLLENLISLKVFDESDFKSEEMKKIINFKY